MALPLEKYIMVSSQIEQITMKSNDFTFDSEPTEFLLVHDKSKTVSFASDIFPEFTFF